jgi:molybdopterin synthase catalytic subunit
MIRIEAERFDPAAELAAFTALVAGAGAVVSFVGLVRSESEGEPVARLELDHYPPLTERSVGGIGADACERFGLAGFAIVHRHGALDPGEPIVFVAAAAAHRRAAFDAVDYMMDRLKTDAAFWKREHDANGARWIEARQSDLEDKARWG